MGWVGLGWVELGWVGRLVEGRRKARWVAVGSNVVEGRMGEEGREEKLSGVV